MRNKQRKSHHIVRIAVSAFILLAGLALVVILKGQSSRIEATAPPATHQSLKSQFSFQSVDGWRQGPSNETSMALFHKADDGCFVSVEYKKGTLDATAELQKILDSHKNSGYTISTDEIVPMSMLTNAGQKEYQLHKYLIDSNGATAESKLMGGNAFGYVALSNGYIEIEGYCNTVEQLTVAIPALQALKFNGTDSLE